MEKVTVIKATEEEIVELIRARFDPEYDSIYAHEGLDNKIWCVTIIKTHPFEEQEVPESSMYMTENYLSILCAEGKLEAGEYIIDCT